MALNQKWYMRIVWELSFQGEGIPFSGLPPSCRLECGSNIIFNVEVETTLKTEAWSLQTI